MNGIMARLGGVLIGLALLLSFLVDCNNTAQGGAIDLRNRITGERLLEHGIDAYRYKWDRDQPEIFCDPYNNPQLPVSKTTATPALLLAQLPLAALPYRLGQFLWLFAQWLLLLGTAWIWLRLCATSRQRWLWMLLVTGFTYTAAWRLHAERGQAYVLLGFLFAIWLWSTLDKKIGNGILAGLVAGLLIALRPPFALLVPFLALHRRGQLPGAAMGLVLGISLPMLIDSASWLNYLSAMATNSEIYRGGWDPAPGPEHFPARIEGIPTDIVGNYVTIPYADFSIHALLRCLGFAPFPATPLLLAVAVAFGVWAWVGRGGAWEKVLTGLAAWLFLADLFLPAYRNSYNDVLILNVAALRLIRAEKTPLAWWPFAIALPLGWGIYVFAPTQAWIINLPTLLFTLGAVMSLFFFGSGAGIRKVGAAC